MIVKNDDISFMSQDNEDIFWGRIYTHKAAYPDTDIWQSQGIVSDRFDGAVTIYSYDDFDADELKAFLKLIGYQSIFCSKNVAEVLGMKSQKQGAIMRCESTQKQPKVIAKKRANENIRDVFDVIYETEKADFSSWYVDISHRLRHNLCRCFSIDIENKPVSVAVTNTETPKNSVISGVATLSEYRRKGYASDVVLTITDDILKGRKSAYLCCNYDLIKFYERLGFVKTGEWVLYV
ncbi:MAG TPA: GNAT family N-acetyltransferase [Clostridiales bacterium]|nr:GNAT family N-acetyltransferase [Clostridiales bacterium]